MTKVKPAAVDCYGNKMEPKPLGEKGYRSEFHGDYCRWEECLKKKRFPVEKKGQP